MRRGAIPATRVPIISCRWMAAAGAAGEDAGHRTFAEIIGGYAYSCFAFGQVAQGEPHAM